MGNFLEHFIEWLLCGFACCVLLTGLICFIAGMAVAGWF